ncbi:kettin homolog isoform X2 [Wyeomyia smithii]|nr:kettin homolog isoform X2 [Wyeomyia smithii]
MEDLNTIIQSNNELDMSTKDQPEAEISNNAVKMTEEVDIHECLSSNVDINFNITGEQEQESSFSEVIVLEKVEAEAVDHIEKNNDCMQSNNIDDTNEDIGYGIKNSEGIYSTEEDFSTESSSDESSEQLVDPSLWKAYDSDDEDATAWFYKKPDEVMQALSEKEKDEQFRKDRLAKRCPVFLTNLTDRSAPIGSEVKLQSSISGVETAVRWLKDDQPVERSSKLQTLAFDGLYSLILKDVQKSDSGVYTIIAKNRGGEVCSSAKVHIFDIIKQDVDVPTIIKIRDYYHHALNDLIIECQILFSPEWKIPDVMWLKEENPVILNKRIRASYEGNEIFQLNIYNPTPDDSGVYTCIVKNIAGERRIMHEVEFTGKAHYLHLPGMHHADRKHFTEDESQEKDKKNKLPDQASNRIRAQQATEPYKQESYIIRDSKNKLTWAGQLNNITIEKGRTVKMICSVNGERPILKWQKNYKPIDYGERIKLLNDGVVAQILIKDVGVADAGEYICTAKNNFNEITTTCILKVIELATTETSPPTFTKAIKGLIIRWDLNLLVKKGKQTWYSPPGDRRARCILHLHYAGIKGLRRARDSSTLHLTSNCLLICILHGKNESFTLQQKRKPKFYT